jgi:hypothetical protein
MINLPASQLNCKLTRNEKENAQSMYFYKRYKKYLAIAHSNKQDLILVRASLKRNQMDSKNTKAALELEVIFKADAIENWNLSLEELKKYNDFKLNRKYPNY